MTPEQQEILRKNAEIDELENQLADMESAYADYCVRLKNFETEYLRLVGPVYAKLDRWQMRIEATELMIMRLRQVRDGVLVAPEDPFKWEIDCANKVRSRWVGSKTAEPSPEQSSGGDFRVNKEAKSLYRELARRFHPDLAENEETREARTKLMAEINQAYRDQDMEKLLELQNRPDIRDPDRETLGEALIRMIRRVAQLRHLVKEAEDRLEDQKETELAQLMEKCIQKGRNEDPFSELMSMLQEQLERSKFEWLNQRVREARLWTEVEK